MTTQRKDYRVGDRAWLEVEIEAAKEGDGIVAVRPVGGALVRSDLRPGAFYVGTVQLHTVPRQDRINDG